MATIFKKAATLHGMSGKLGNIVLFNKKGTQMASIYNDEPRDNNSVTQVLQQAIFGNYVQLYKAFKDVIKDAYQFKTANQSDYNCFMKDNLKNSTAVYLTKEESEQKTAILTDVIISKGDLDSIVIGEVNSGEYSTDINLTITIDASTTIGDLSKDIVNNNQTFDFGETITYVSATQTIDSVTSVAKTRCAWYELNLDKTNSVKVFDMFGQEPFKNINGKLGRNALSDMHGFTYVHGKKTQDGSKLVSTQRLIVSNSLLTYYTSEEAMEAALESYKAKDEAVVVPNAAGTSQTGGYISGGGVQPTPPTPTTPVTITAKVATGQEAQGTVKAGSAAAGATSSVTVEKDTSVQVVATPASGYKFKKWNTDETTATLNLIANADTTVTATFEPDSPTGTVTVTLTSAEPSQGKVQINTGEVGATATATVQSGAATVIKGIPEAGYTFSKWSDGGLQFERTINPTVDTSLTATFEAE